MGVSSHRRCRCQWMLSLLLLIPVLAPAQQSALQARVEMMRNGHRLKDASQAVVWLNPVAGATLETPRQDASKIPQLVQKNKSFQPSLLVIPVGGKVEFPNHDPFFHNVFSLFEGKRFDLGLYEAGTSRTVRFDRPGISYIFCNIHPQMSAVIITLTTPLYAISNADGQITLAGVPYGRYKMHVWS